MQINWDSFKVFNQDLRGIRYKFEDLCRHLFVNENLLGNKQFRYLHANPNNCGLETEPIYDEINKRWIGFQVKYFDDEVGYDQIKDSAQKIVKYYTGKESLVNLVFLFCNKPLTTSAKGYIDAKELLEDYGIELQLVTDTTILDLVFRKYPYLASYYFGNLTLQPEWFRNQAGYMYDILGERYNHEFNVETRAQDELSLFVHDKRAVQYLNFKKNRLLKKIDSIYYTRNDRDYLIALRNAVLGLSDVDEESLYSSQEWISRIKESVKLFLEKYISIRSQLDDQRKNVNSILTDKRKTKSERDDALKEFDDLKNRIREVDKSRWSLTLLNFYIYRADNDLKDLQPDERKEKRQLIIKPLVEAYFSWCHQNEYRVSEKGKTRNGISYSLNQEEYLKVFIDDPFIPLDNNSAEQSIRNFCIGKKNFVMIDTLSGAKASAIIYSIVETAKANNLNVYGYINYLLTEIPRHMDDKNLDFCEQLLPWSEQLPEECRKKK